MKDEEVNKIIAEYMGVKAITQTMLNMGKLNYTESLDALIPVWIKLGSTDIELHTYRENEASVTPTDFLSTGSAIGISIQQSAAHATARAILELNKKE